MQSSFSSTQPGQHQLDWLDRALSSSKAHWRIVVGHHPVFSGGRHGSTPSLVTELKPLLDRHKVQVYLNGHDHDLQHIVTDGVHYVTSGAGAKTRPTSPIQGTMFAAAELGFLSVKLSAEWLSIDFVTTDGAVVHSATISVT
jgi:tartrate-resistant acid phosphatase type 5